MIDAIAKGEFDSVFRIGDLLTAGFDTGLISDYCCSYATFTSCVVIGDTDGRS